MPSFLKKISSFAGINLSPKEKSLRSSTQKQHQHKSTQPYGNQPTHPPNKEPREGRTRHAQREATSNNTSTQSSKSSTPTLSSSSSLSLNLCDSPASIASCGPSSYQASSEAVRTRLSYFKDGSFESTIPQPPHPPMNNKSAPILHSIELYTQEQDPSSPSFSPSITMPSAAAGTQEETSHSTTSAPAQMTNRTSMDPLAVLFHPRSRSMPMLQDSNSGFVPDQHQIKHYHSTLLSPTSTTSPASSSQRDSMDNTFSNSTNTKRMSSNFPLGASKTVKGKRSRPMSLFLQNDQQINSPQPRLPHQSKSTRWANRGGIGANEMMVDLETTGVFVPSNGRRLRAEFVYRSVIMCADEIRQRGLVHPNIFTNPSPKKVITAMIALMIDQDRCDLYSMKCLRIDTVASLLLNLMSQMSNPIIPYTIMEHYFQQSGHTTRSSSSPSPPTSRRNSENPRQSVERPYFATVGDSLPVIPVLPLKDASRASSHAGYVWAREYFDLHSFLAVLPAMNRVILLEVLHLCQELLDHQIQNRLTIHRLVQQIAPALFSNVFDQKILETMAGGSRRCSVYGDSISSQDGSRAETHLFMVILVRFLAVSSANYNGPTVDPCMSTFRNAVSDEGSSSSMQNVEPFGRHPSHAPSSSSSGVEESVYQNQSSAFRESQQWHQNEQQEYHYRMERSFQEMEILQRPSQHFGYHPTKHDQAVQQQQQQQQQQKQNKRLSSVSVSVLGISKKIHDPRRSPSQDTNTGLSVSDSFALPGPSLEIGHRDHIWNGRHRLEHQGTIVM